MYGLPVENFCLKTLIPSSQVYAGRLPSGQGIAVKRQGEAGVLGNKQFDVEVSILNMLWHPNIVRLLGICSQGKEHLAVLELATKVREDLTTL